MSEGGVEVRQPQRIKWYRCPVPREALARLNKRSNVLGFAQTLGFLAVLAGNGALAVYSFYHWPWYVTVLLTFWHGTWWHFLVNGFHELVHESVFRQRWLNAVFLRVFAFLSWNNHHWFWASHTEHHKYTLHDPDDLEVVLPMKFTVGGYLKAAFVDVRWPWHTFRGQFRRALGHYNPKGDKWTAHLFPESEQDGRRKLIRWARVLLIGHGLIVGVSLAMGWWMVPVVITLAPMYGKWLQFLCNECQHAGLAEKVSDYRLCCRTIYLNPFLRFMYWHMNYHTEHHMYAAVPCYRLGALHRVIKADMPRCQRGLIRTWLHIAEIVRRQRREPSYQYLAEVPTTPPARVA